jgi:soluble lytic murein transglycosylase
VAPELALAIARRESEFDPAIVSPADARGLMQILPGTADLMARRLGIEVETAALTRDAELNARLGAEYLAQLAEEFGQSVVLIAAGYNAGPGRPRRWVQEFGDPRMPGVDPIDWIEAVPFTETRNYIMRVMESLVVYRARLAGAPVPLRLTEELSAR